MADTKAKIELPEINLHVFGTRPEDQIFLPAMGPFSVRADCKSGQWKIGDEDFIGKELELSIIKAARFVGNLGKTQGEVWLQIFFVPVPGLPSSEKLPQNTVCVTYLKKRSINQFSETLYKVMETAEPALGIFTGSLIKHTSDLGDYYSVKFDWRERKTDEEIEQLEMIANFLAIEPELIDLDRTNNMTLVEGKSQSEIQEIIESYKQRAEAAAQQAAAPALPQAS